MWLSLIFVGLFIALAIKQATQGTFSALIMLVLTACCAAAALGSYEFVAAQWLAPLWKPEFALALSLGVTFAIPLVILRLVFDKLVRRSCLLPGMVERIGSGAFGLLTAMIIVGIAAMCLQMVPFAKGSIIGSSRLPVMSIAEANAGETIGDADGQGKLRELWLSPDRFAAGVGSVLLGGIFSGTESFHEVQPDPIGTLVWMAAVPGGVGTYAPPGSISVRAASKVSAVYKMTRADERAGKPAEFVDEAAPGGSEFQMVRVRLGAEARDENKSHLFTLRQFRLVGRHNDAVEQFPGIAVRLDEASIDLTRHVRAIKVRDKFWPVLDEIFAPGDTGDIEVVFEVPTGFQPSFVEFRRCAKAPVKLGKPEAREASAPPAGEAIPTATKPEPPAPITEPATPPDAEGDRSSRRSRRSTGSEEPEKPADASKPGARVRGVAAQGEDSFFGDDFPLALTAYRKGTNAEVSGGKLASGILVAEVDRQSEGTDPPVSKFDVPDDKRLLQLSSTRLKAGSTLGGALSYATTTLQNYFVEDEAGTRYELAGKYAIADDSGTKVFEVQYFSEPVGSVGGIGKFTRINEKNLKADDTFVLLFLVDPGARIKTFSTGGAATRKDDLTLSDLVAPE